MSDPCEPQPVRSVLQLNMGRGAQRTAPAEGNGKLMGYLDRRAACRHKPYGAHPATRDRGGFRTLAENARLSQTFLSLWHLYITSNHAADRSASASSPLLLHLKERPTWNM